MHFEVLSLKISPKNMVAVEEGTVMEIFSYNVDLMDEIGQGGF